MKKNGKIKNQKGKSLSRRNFIGTLGAASAALTIIPRHTLGGIGYTAPSDMLNVAGIGVGGRGISDITAICPLEVDERQVLKITYDDATAEANNKVAYYEEDDEPRKPEKLANIYALCDVDEERAFRTFKGYPKAKIYKDFRKMLEKEKSIDAVVIATPDHTHAVAAMMAMKMGKHVYCEKPLTHTVFEARDWPKQPKKLVWPHRWETRAWLLMPTGSLRNGFGLALSAMCAKYMPGQTGRSGHRELTGLWILQLYPALSTGTYGLALLLNGPITRPMCLSPGGAGSISEAVP